MAVLLLSLPRTPSMWLLVWAVLLAVVRPSPAAAQGQNGIITCYCNTGHKCNYTTNTCEEDGQIRHCHSRVVLTKEGGGGFYELKQYCIANLLPCLQEKGQCCESDLCNKCPMWELLNQPLEVVRQVQFPPECNITIPEPTEELLTSSVLSGSGRAWWLVVVIVLAVVVLIVIPLSIIVFCYVVCISRKQRSSDVESVGDHVYDDPYRSDDSSRFVNDRPLKIKTFAEKVVRKQKIGKGGSGQVWLGDYEGRPVAIKVLTTLHTAMWKRETDIYQTHMLSHPNILAFITNEVYEKQYVELWLVFEYHQRGSLFSYLNNHTLSPSTCLSFLSSIAEGLNYLHSFITTGTDCQKPIIAHRDLKTGNILVINDSTCCISDFGLAVKESDFSSDKDVPDHAVGTKRYLAPEILDGTIQKRRLDSYVMADMYSLALVMWEVARRCNWRGNSQEVPSYEVPYASIVPDNPAIEDMKKVVVEDEYRPCIDPTWKNNEMLSKVCTLIHDSWRPNPHARINSTRVKLNLKSLAPSNDI